jgi:hypothetical protein
MNHSKCIFGDKKPSKLMVTPEGLEKLKKNSKAFLRDDERMYLISGEMLQALDEKKGHEVSEDKHVAVTAFIVGTSVFEYKKNTKQALKVIMDCDGYVKDHVLWPDYFTQELVYPAELKKGCICTIFLKKREGTSDPATIQKIIIEA